jgi:transposase
MPRTYTLLSPEAEKQIRRRMKESTSVWEYRRLQCVSLRRVGLTAGDVARIVGLHRSSVLRVWSMFQRGGIDALLKEKRGRARGRARWTPEEERAFLQPFLNAAERGKLTTVKDVYRAHCAHARKTLDRTATYRLLARHDWRKVVPRQQHPKADKAAQERFKIFFPHTGYVGEVRSSPLWAPFPVDVLG